MKENNIVRFSSENLPKGNTDWARLRAMTEEEIEQNALDDPDNPPLTEEDFRNAKWVIRYPENKVPLSIRLDREVIEYFKRQGDGYQSRISAVLLAYVRTQEDNRAKKRRKK